MNLTLSLALFLFTTIIYGQNLAPNPNFQEFSDCPNDVGSFTVLNWITPFWPGTPDYFNICGVVDVNVPNNFAGIQESTAGGSYIGMYTYGGNVHEFIQAELTSPTKAGMTYELSIIYSSPENYGHADGLGMLLSVGEPSGSFGQTPQMEKTTVIENQTEWHTLTYQYISPGGETHVTIGNFNNDAITNFVPNGMYQSHGYYYIDSVSVTLNCEEVPSSDIIVDLGEDMNICNFEFPITISSSLPNAHNEWNTGQIGSSIEVTNPGIYHVKSFFDCEYGVDTIEIIRIEEPTIFQEDETLCAEESVTITLDANLGTYEWSDGSTDSEILVTENGFYSVTLTYSCGIVIDSVEVLLGDAFEEINIDEMYVLCENEALTIDLSSLIGNTISWSDGGTELLRIIDSPGAYFVEIRNACNEAYFSFDFEQKDCLKEKIYIPNVFSPNNDGANDFFSIWFSEKWLAPKIKFQIYNRWGQLIFYSEDPYFQWDGSFLGSSLNPGVYTYYFELEVDVSGERQTIRKADEITIIR